MQLVHLFVIFVLLVALVCLVCANTRKLGGDYEKRTVSDDKVAQQYWLALARDVALLLSERVDIQQYAPHQRQMAQEINDNIEIVGQFMNELEMHEMKSMLPFDMNEVTVEEYRTRLEEYRAQIELMRARIIIITNMIKSQKAYIAKTGGFSFAGFTRLFSKKPKFTSESIPTQTPVSAPTPLANCKEHIDALVSQIVEFKRVSGKLRSSKIIRRPLPIPPRKPNIPLPSLPMTIGLENDTRTEPPPFSSAPLSPEEKKISEQGPAIPW